MWYFIIKRDSIKNNQYQQMQKLAELTEVEMFSEPYDNYCLFEVTKEKYREAMDYLDIEGVSYKLANNRPSRDELLASMKSSSA